MDNQKKKNGEENMNNTNNCKLVDLSMFSSFCDWEECDEEESNSEFEEEQLQNKENTMKIKSTPETVEEPDFCNENEEMLSSNMQSFEYKEMNENEIENLYKYYLSGTTGNTCIQSTDVLVVSHETDMYKFNYNLTYQSPSHYSIQEYKIILKSHTVNNSHKDDKCIYLYRNSKTVFFWHDDYNSYKNLNQKLLPNNINIINWLHKINYSGSICESIIQQIYPGYNHSSFIFLFFQYLDMTDDLLKTKIDMSKYDLLTVYLESTWLNDQVINKYFFLIKIRNNKIEEKNIHVFDTFFWVRLSSRGYNQVKNDTRRVDIFSFKKLLIPINTSSHWVLICVDVLFKKIIYYDSIYSSKNMHIQLFSNIVADYLVNEHLEKKGVSLNKNELSYVDGNSPLQTNSDDCGVFTCINGELFSRDKPSDSFNHTHINLYRQKIVFELLNKELMT